MTDYPTVGLKVDLTGIDQGEKAYDRLKSTIIGVGQAADSVSGKLSRSTQQTKAATAAAVGGDQERAKSAEKAARDEERAAQRAAREQERQRKYLQQVRINSMRMEETARKAAEIDQARAAARTMQEAARVAREQERASRMASAAAERARREEVRSAEKAAKDQEAIERGILAFRLRMRGQEFRQATKADADILAFRQRMAAQQIREERAAAAEAEKSRRYLLSVRLRSIEMEEAAQRRADAEALRRARDLARVSRGGGGSIGGGGGGGSIGGGDGSGFIRATEGALARLRGSLAETRRLFFDLRTAVGLFLGGLVIKPIVDMADAMTALKARAAAFTTSSTDVPYLMEAIFATAQRARTPLEAIATLYTRLAPLAKQLGKSQMELLRITETVAKGFQIGGATPEEAKSASQQLAQALASNRLGGDELRSLAENAPILMAKIANALNMNTGEFIKWAHSGKANAAVVIDAIEKAQVEIDRIFSAFPVTIGQSVTLVTNSLTNLVGKVNEATGATVAIGGAISTFSAFLDQKSTLDAITGAVNALGKALGFLGDAFHLVGTMLPVIAAILAMMAVTKLVAIAQGWMGVSKAMLAYQLAAAISGRATATLAAAQTGLAAAGAAAARSMGALLAVVGGPIGAAVIALVAAFTLLKKAHDDAASASQRYKDSQEGAINALSRATAFAQAYGINTDNLTKAMNSATGATHSATTAHDGAMKAAMARAEAERLLTVRILEREAADAGKEARKSLGSVTGIAGLRNQRRLNELNLKNPFLSKEQRQAFEQGNANLDRQIIDASKSAIEGFKLQGVLKQQAEELRNAKLKLTIPDTAGAPQAPKPTDKNKANPFERALDGIQKLEAAIAGLKAEIATISSNPLDVLAAQIKRAGDEAAASLEAGDKQNQMLADKTRNLAMEKERLEITKRMLQESADNTRQINMEAAANDALGRAQLTSTQIMKDFWASGSRTLEGYNAALARSRQVQADAEVAASDLNIAQRYGVQTLGEIAKSYQAATGSTEAYSQQVQAAAVNEAAAAAASIRRKAALDALANQDSDLQAFNSKTYEDADKTLQHMVTLTDNLGDSLAAAFGRGGAALGQMLRVLNGYSAKQLEVNRRVADAQVLYGKGSGRALEEERRGAEELAQARIQGYADMASAAKTFFDEGSAGYKALQVAETAFRLYEFAMSAKSIAVKAVETAAKIGFFGAQAQAAAAAGAANMFATLGPAGFAAVAAMVAVLAGLGVALSGGGGGGSRRQTAEDRQKLQGTGSVLGDAAAQSESIARALEIVASNTNESLEYSNDMLTALRSIDSNISALTASLARQLGVGGFLSNDVEGLGTSRKGPSTLATLAVGGPVGLAISKLPVIGGLINTLFGTKKTTTLQDAGISFGSGSLSDILNQGINAQTYQELATQTKKKFFGVTYSNKTKVTTNTAPLDEDITAEITRVIDSLRSGVLAAAGALGVTGAQAALDAMTIDLGKISFKDMTGEEIEQALQAIFSKLGDDMATIALPMVSELQKAGEGAFETLVRIARDYQVVDVSLKSIGLTFGAVGTSSIKARERLIELSGGIDQFASQTSYFAENFLSDQERIAPVIEAVYTELGKLGYGSIKTKDEFKALVKSLDLTTEQGAQTYATLMKLAPGFAQIIDYTEGLKAANDNVSDAQGALNDAYETARDLILDNRDAMLELVDSLKAYRQELETGPLAANSPQDQYQKTKALFESTSALALGGDKQALANLQSVSQAYLEASKEYYASTEPYFQDLAAVKTVIEQAQAYAQTQVDVANQQLAALNQMVAGFITVNTSVLTVAQAVTNVQTAIVDLKSALAEQAAALKAAADAAAAAANQNKPGGGPDTAALDVARYLAQNPDLKANWDAGGIMRQWGATLEEATRYQYETLGKNEIANDQRQLYSDVPVTQAPAPQAAAAPSADADVKALTAAVKDLATEAKVGNVLAQAGFKQLSAKADEQLEGQEDLKRAVRAAA